MNYFSNSKRNTLFLFFAGTLSLAALAGIFFASAPSSLLLSKFTPNTPITAQNAALNWTGGSDNSYRSRLSVVYVSRLDILTLAILKKGGSMSDTQFRTYLTNLSAGLSNLGSKPAYANDAEVQNILGFISFETNAALLALSSNSTSVVSEIASLIEGTSTPVDVTPTCGTASRKTFASTPSANLCVTGTPSAVQPDGTSAFSWSCAGSENKIQYCFAYNGEGYTNVVNGGGVSACNAQVLENYGTQKHTCSIGGGCALNGLPVSASNPSANPQHAGLCVKTSDWNKAY